MLLPLERDRQVKIWTFKFTGNHAMAIKVVIAEMYERAAALAKVDQEMNDQPFDMVTVESHDRWDCEAILVDASYIE